MILTKDLLNDLSELETSIRLLTLTQSPTNIQVESFLRNLEKRRYSILNQIKLYNKTIEYSSQKIKNISDNYKVGFDNDNNILKIYVPETMPSYKNLKTHAYKNILINIAEKLQGYNNLFDTPIFVYIKIFNKIDNWDIDNKFIKPIFDSLILSKVITDDNINNVFYSVRGEKSDIPHTEIYVTDINNSVNLFKIMLG